MTCDMSQRLISCVTWTLIQHPYPTKSPIMVCAILANGISISLEVDIRTHFVQNILKVFNFGMSNLTGSFT